MKYRIHTEYYKGWRAHIVDNETNISMAQSYGITRIGAYLGAWFRRWWM